MTRNNTVYVEVRGSVAELVMNRPEVLNAKNWQMANDFHAALDELEAAPQLRVVVVTGKGGTFSTGIDLEALSEGQLKIDWFRRFDEAVRRLEQLEALTIAKIRGYAVGGGLWSLWVATFGSRRRTHSSACRLFWKRLFPEWASTVCHGSLV